MDNLSTLKRHMITKYTVHKNKAGQVMHRLASFSDCLPLISATADSLGQGLAMSFVFYIKRNCNTNV